MLTFPYKNEVWECELAERWNNPLWSSGYELLLPCIVLWHFWHLLNFHSRQTRKPANVQCYPLEPLEFFLHQLMWRSGLDHSDLERSRYLLLSMLWLSSPGYSCNKDVIEIDVHWEDVGANGFDEYLQESGNPHVSGSFCQLKALYWKPLNRIMTAIW